MDDWNRPSVSFRCNYLRPPTATWGYLIIRTSYDPALEPAWQRTLQKIKDTIYSTIDYELRYPQSWMKLPVEDCIRIKNEGFSFLGLPPPDPAPVDDLKNRLRFILLEDPAQYRGLSTTQVQERFDEWCIQHSQQLARERGVVLEPMTELGPTPVSNNVCLWIDEEVLKVVDGDIKNEFGEGPYVKAVERRPVLSPDYDGSFKVELGYLWQMYGDAFNSGGLDQFLPPKRRKTGERPVWNGSWPFDVQMESMGMDEKEMEEEWGKRGEAKVLNAI
ncbi:uncharacterized protein CDV56_102858 [Aspergillus thermomutatus]|uniref:Uncharacterized protein n=1 Tax=Aspergillus thermomutatus TaxID=41047 RepID=A0A397GAZ7_ASPTH|nr:uncharacterized protein CDV56_102858 [Aspergillus thermomutatus]RHZ48195.1 hypothetical protein CDV56_102858 [Aspergillus thermomutatus]